MTEGYSGTPLIKKLGIKPGMKMCVLNPPPDYDSLIGDLPPAVEQVSLDAASLDFIHVFVRWRAEFEKDFFMLKSALILNGMLWVSWLKKSSKQPTDLTEDLIRDFALANGLVDVKVCAIDKDWSGLKLVYRLKDR